MLCLAICGYGSILSTSPRPQRTPEWVEPAKHEGKLIPKRHNNALPVRFLESPTDIEHSAKEDVFTSHTKTKTKTRGVANPPDPARAAETTDQQGDHLMPAHEQPQITFAVDTCALKVFRTISFTPSADATPGEIPWADFLYAMVDIGFAYQHLGGSEYRFSSVTMNLDRSIHFHEPHPGRKVPYNIARDFGHRLNRAYGWHGQMFTLAAKGAR